MSQNGSALNDKNLKSFAIINKVASEYVQESNNIRKEILYKKLWEKCLAYVLRLDISQESSVLEDKIDKKLYANEKIRENTFCDLNKTVDMEVFVKTFKYSIEKYAEAPGEEFSRLFTSTYKIRNKAAAGVEGARRKLHGFHSSDNDKEMWSAFNKLIKAYSVKDERFKGKQLDDLSPQDIHNILDDAGVGFKDEERYVEIAQQFAKATQTVALDKPFEDEGGSKDIEDSYNLDDSATEDNYIINLFRNTIEMASKIQRPYFVCFITLEVFNNYNRALPKDMKSLINNDFWDYINDYADSELGSTEEVPDVLIAQFLKVKAPAISKQRDNFKSAFKKAYSMLEK